MGVKKFVLTGGPHSGKPSLIMELEKKWMNLISEVPRIIIDQEPRRGSKTPGYMDILPGKKQEEFNKLFIEKQIDLKKSVKDGAVFLDRSLVDPIVYADFCNAGMEPGPNRHIQNAGYEKAFFLESIPGRLNNEERGENKGDGKRIHEMFPDTYSSLGIDVNNVDIFHVGDLGIKKRVEHTLESIRR